MAKPSMAAMNVASAWRMARARHAAMDTLVAMGAGAAWLHGFWTTVSAGHGHFLAPAMIVAFVLIGRLLEARARARAGSALRELAERAPRSARVLRDGTTETVPADAVRLDELVIVGEGEAAPVDGEVLEGGEHPGLVAQPEQGLVVVARRRAEDLHGHALGDLSDALGGEIDLPEASATETLVHGVGGLTGHPPRMVPRVPSILQSQVHFPVRGASTARSR